MNDYDSSEEVSPAKVNDAIYFFTRKPIDKGML